MPSVINFIELRAIRDKYQIVPEIPILLPPPRATADAIIDGFCCVYEIWLEKYELMFPIHPLLLYFVEALGLTLPQSLPNFVSRGPRTVGQTHEQ